MGRSDAIMETMVLMINSYVVVVLYEFINNTIVSSLAAGRPNLRVTGHIWIWTESKVDQIRIQTESKLYFMSGPKGVQTTQNWDKENSGDVEEIQLNRFLERLQILISCLFEQ